MATWRYKISLPELENILLVGCIHSSVIFSSLKRNFVSQHSHVTSSFYQIHYYQNSCTCSFCNKVKSYLMFPPSPLQVLVYLSGGSVVWLLVYLFIYLFVFLPLNHRFKCDLLFGGGGGVRACGCLSALQCDAGFKPQVPWAPDLHLRRGH